MASSSHDENAKEEEESKSTIDDTSAWNYSELINNAPPLPIVRWSSSLHGGGRCANARPLSPPSHQHRSSDSSDPNDSSLPDGGGGGNNNITLDDENRREGARTASPSHSRERTARGAPAGLLLLATCSLISVVLLVGLLASPSARHAMFGTPDRYVAFIGNSVMYYYDLPRSLQIVSDHKVQQNCLLSGAGSFTRMPFLQNGMWNRWRADGALLYTLSDDEVVNANANNGNSFYDNRVWDLGACTMHMLLFGYNHTEAQENYDDFWVNYREENGVTDDDAWVYDYNEGSELDPRLNDACAQSQAYLDFLNHLPGSDIRRNPRKWDYLVLVDRTAGPKYNTSRESGVSALGEIYLPFFQQTKAIPVFLVTAAYCKDRDDTATLDQIPELTVTVYMGYKQYAKFLQQTLPRSQKPKLVNMGIAFLVVYEENLDMWYSLFWSDNKHPSPLGSFLESCLLHHVIYGRVPYKSTVIRDDMQSLWNGTRNLMYPRDTVVPFPTKQEAEYLYNVCKRVAGGYIPPTFRAQLKNGLSLYR